MNSQYNKGKEGLFIITGGLATFFGLSFSAQNEKFYQRCIFPFINCFDPERSHAWTLRFLSWGLFSSRNNLKQFPELKTQILNLELPNPVGIAAGFDKDGIAIEGLFGLGFGFVEVGSITPEPQEGNPKPRVFRLTEDRAIINRYGFNSSGHMVVFKNVCDWRKRTQNSNKILGINLGKNKNSKDGIEDYVQGVQLFGPKSDYLVINISSPNTPGLRDYQFGNLLADLINKVTSALNELPKDQRPLLFFKVAPDLNFEEKKSIAQLILNSIKNPNFNGVSGLIVTNTTITRPSTLSSSSKTEIGGLSGLPLKSLSTKCIEDFFKLTQGKILIIGVGGISNAEDAYEKIKAGASLVQLYTGLVYNGPALISNICKELATLLKDDGYANIKEVVGVNVDIKKKPN